MKDRTQFNTRMKSYEQPYRFTLPRRTYTVIRVDGRAFHMLLRSCDRPYDTVFMGAMDAVALELCEEVQGAKMAYVQSDEVSILATDFDRTNTQPWFDGILAKQISVSASIATWMFNSSVEEYEPITGYAEFDSRVFTIPDQVEVANYFVWRQRDATRNSITMAAQSKFSHSQLQGVDTDQMQEMLWSEHQINWSEYPEGFKRGRVVVPHEVGTGWRILAAPIFISQPGTFLASVVPPMPNLSDS